MPVCCARALTSVSVLQRLDWEDWPHKCAVDCLRLMPMHERLVLVTKSEDGWLATWDLLRGELLMRWQVHLSGLW